MNLYTKIRKLIVGPEFSKGFISNAVRKTAIKLISRIIKPSEKILEVGCGEGLFIKISAKLCPSSYFYGIDHNDEIIAYDRYKLIEEKITNCEVKTAEGSTIPYTDNMFDYAFILNTVYNIKDPQDVKKIVQEMLRVVKPGGKVFLDFRNKNNVVFKLVYLYFRKFDSTDPKIFLHTKKQLTELLNDLSDEFIFYPTSMFGFGYILEITKRKL